jgi:hypothetical protein
VHYDKDKGSSYKLGYVYDTRVAWKVGLAHAEGQWLLFMRDATKFINKKSLSTLMEVRGRVSEAILLVQIEDNTVGLSFREGVLSGILAPKDLVLDSEHLLSCTKDVWEFLHAHGPMAHHTFLVVAEALFSRRLVSQE